jgi:hypothetical protein
VKLKAEIVLTPQTRYQDDSKYPAQCTSSNHGLQHRTHEHTEWPSFKINDAIKNLISEFFLLLDNEDTNVGDKLADDIFASNGQAKFGGHTFVGKDGNSLSFAKKCDQFINDMYS